MKKYLLLCMLIGQVVCAKPTYSIYDSIQVLHKSLYFDIRDFDTQILSGKAELSIQSKTNGLKFAPLLLLQMQIDSILVDGKRVTGYQYNDTLLRIPLPGSLAQGETSHLLIAYHGKPQGSTFGGFLFNKELRMAHNMGASIHDIPHSFGRGWFPATDDFRSRSTFDLYFRVDNNLKAIGSGILKDSVAHKDGSTTWHWAVNQPIPDYLVNVAVGDYRKIHFEHKQSTKILPIDVYVLPNEVEAAKEAYSIVPRILEIMEKHFGAYDFDRVGFVSVDSPGGAMEHVGNISMPMNPKAEPGYQLLIMHELIHGWFGNKVTCETEGDMWLNEGLTTFCPEIVLAEINTPEAAKKYATNNLLSVLHATQLYDGGHYPLAELPSDHTYGITAYNKGAAVMHTLRQYLGDDLLFPAMKAYIDTFAFRSANTVDFKNAISKHTGKDLTDFFDLWVDQPGFPAFEIDSIITSPAIEGYKETIYLEQKLCNATHYGHNVRVPITLFDAEGKQSEEFDAIVTGEKTSFLVQTTFKPAYGIVNRNNDIATASFVYPIQLHNKGFYSFKQCYIDLECKQITEPTTVYLQHYWVAPDAMKEKNSIQLSDSHYWRLAGNIPPSCQLSGKFTLDKKFLDSRLLANTPNEIVVMYRDTPASEWSKIHSEPLSNQDEITVDHLQPGEFCLAIVP